jgi:hypothetical protein
LALVIPVKVDYVKADTAIEESLAVIAIELERADWAASEIVRPRAAV